MMLLAAGLLAASLCWLGFTQLTKRKPSPPPAVEETLNERNLLEMKTDSFRALVQRVYGSEAKLEAGKDIKLSLEGQGRKVTNFFNDNPLLTRVKSDDFSISYDSVRYVVKAEFKVREKDKVSYIVVPADVVYKLAEMAQNK